ncbi:HNH endonuclease [Streptomyces sp. NBRC 110035]|uniref:HNH endonuclease n=1 Tax=Streptomyces sp. NBRC 110035 TaxID=1547867 RepID=UPI000697A019|nr:HNH endonuclease [Streptomyces sp. NBRC 110035]
MAEDPGYREMMRKSSRESHRKFYPERRAVIQQRVKRRRLQYLAENANRVQDPKVLKRCAGQCGQMLPETEFRLNRGVAGGLRARCNHCSDACKRARRTCFEAFGDPVGQACYLCGHEIEALPDAWVDHVIPQSQSGPDTADNVRWTHELCNLSRGAKPLTPEQFQRFQRIVPTFPGAQK